MKVFYITFIILMTLLFIGNLMTYPLQHFFVFRPIELAPDYEFKFKNSFEEVNLKTDDGGIINALHFKEPGPKDVILYFHGNTGSLMRWAELNDKFRKLGYDLFIMDFQSFRKSTGPMSEKAFYNDAKQCYQHVVKQYDVNEIITYGRSMGSFPASYLAS
jgi:predicted alpha/beta-fold hydrolase